jgi:hypothetical protein
MNIRIKNKSLKYYLQFEYKIIKYGKEKPLRLQIRRDLYPPRWQHRRTEQKDSVYLRDKRQTLRSP